MTTEPTNQQAPQQPSQPPSQPTAQPTPPPASPNADQQYASFDNGSTRPPRRLVRRSDDKLLGGVCSGLADHLGLDPTLVRVLTVVATVLGFGSIVIAYLVAWVIVPKDVDVVPAAPVGTVESRDIVSPAPGR
jgi:phage shock protein C